MLLRRLKDRSGRTLRQLEEEATRNGDALARSTIADLLRRSTLPRPDRLAAFVRACGAEEQLPEWLRAHERLSEVQPVDAAASSPAGTAKRRLVPWVVALAALAVAALVAVGVLLVIDLKDKPATAAQPSAPTGRAEVLPVRSAGSWARIRPLGAPGLCLTEGRDHTGRYRSAVAVQRPCAETGGPRTFIQPIGNDLTHIKWEHPRSKVMGCLTALDNGPAKDLLEPQEECSADKGGQLFRIERVTGTDAYRLHRAGTGLCVGTRDTAAQTEASQEACRDDSHQYFLVDLDQPG
ncbi:XRE family transcriptional regulator [Amycolatopsis sp. NPDC021455]|uniref:helix-turn-helix domain-containing protein n=1 Tax=Amycolatopsis sp. NPDC021455 TaxID=3154901 RepID=UPI0033E23F27